MTATRPTITCPDVIRAPSVPRDVLRPRFESITRKGPDEKLFWKPKLIRCPRLAFATRLIERLRRSPRFVVSMPEPAETSNSRICLLKFSVGHVEEKESFNNTHDGRDEGPTEEQV